MLTLAIMFKKCHLHTPQSIFFINLSLEGWTHFQGVGLLSAKPLKTSTKLNKVSPVPAHSLIRALLLTALIVWPA